MWLAYNEISVLKVVFYFIYQSVMTLQKLQMTPYFKTKGSFQKFMARRNTRLCITSKLRMLITKLLTNSYRQKKNHFDSPRYSSNHIIIFFGKEIVNVIVILLWFYYVIVTTVLIPILQFEQKTNRVYVINEMK